MLEPCATEAPLEDSVVENDAVPVVEGLKIVVDCSAEESVDLEIHWATTTRCTDDHY